MPQILYTDDILIDLDDMDVNPSPSASGEPSSSKLVLHRVKNSPKGMYLQPFVCRLFEVSVSQFF